MWLYAFPRSPANICWLTCLILAWTLMNSVQAISMHKWVSYDCGEFSCCYEEPNCVNDLKRGEDAQRCIRSLASNCSIEVWSYVEMGRDDFCMGNARHLRVDLSKLIGGEIMSSRSSLKNHNPRGRLQRDQNLIYPDTYWYEDMVVLLTTVPKPEQLNAPWCDYLSSILFNNDTSEVIHLSNRTQQTYTWIDFHLPNRENLTLITNENSLWTFSITGQTSQAQGKLDAYNRTDVWEKWPLPDHPELEADAPEAYSLVDASPIITTMNTVATASITTHPISQASTRPVSQARDTSVYMDIPQGYVENFTLVNGFPESVFRFKYEALSDLRFGLFVKQIVRGEHTAEIDASADSSFTTVAMGAAETSLTGKGVIYPLFHRVPRDIRRRLQAILDKGNNSDKSLSSNVIHFASFGLIAGAVIAGLLQVQLAICNTQRQQALQDKSSLGPVKAETQRFEEARKKQEVAAIIRRRRLANISPEARAQFFLSRAAKRARKLSTVPEQ